MRETQVRSLGQEDPLEKGMATHSSILPLEIPWTEEPGKHGIAKQSDTTWRVNNSNRVGIQTPLRAAGRARPRARLSCLAFRPERHPRLLRRAGVYDAVCVHRQPTPVHFLC